MRISDWSSDVCSSDLNRRRAARGESSRAPARAARPGSIRWEQTRVGREDRPSSHCLEKRLVEAEVGGVGSEVRPQAGGLEAAEQQAVLAFALELVAEQGLRRADLAFHTADLFDMGDAAHAVPHCSSARAAGEECVSTGKSW